MMKELKGKIEFMELIIENLQYIYEEIDLDDFDVEAYDDWSYKLGKNAAELLKLISTTDNMVEKMSKEDK